MPWLNQRKQSPVSFAGLLKIALAACVFTPAVHAENFVTQIKPVKLVYESNASSRKPTLVITCAEYFTSTGECSWFNFNGTTNVADIKSQGAYKRPTMQAFINWHPFADAFRITTGAFLGSNRLNVTGNIKCNSSIAVGSSTYASGQINTLSGDVEFARTAEPYLGVGWAKTFRGGRISCFADYGILFTSPAKTSLQATGDLAADPSFQSNLRQEEKEISQALKPLRYYTIAQIGLMFKF